MTEVWVVIIHESNGEMHRPRVFSTGAQAGSWAVKNSTEPRRSAGLYAAVIDDEEDL